MDLGRFRVAVDRGRIEWRRHVLERITARGILQSQVVDVLLTGEQIEDYSEDRPYPSALFLGFQSGKPIHVVASFDEEGDYAYIITAYQPNLDVFDTDFKTRRKR